MQNKNFMDAKGVYEAYDRWINGPTPFENQYFVRERFYSFVIMCVKYVKEVRFVTKQEAWKSINMDILKERLENDLAELRAHNYAAYEERLHEILVKFETLIEYEKVRYSHGLR